MSDARTEVESAANWVKKNPAKISLAVRAAVRRSGQTVDNITRMTGTLRTALRDAGWTWSEAPKDDEETSSSASSATTTARRSMGGCRPLSSRPTGPCPLQHPRRTAGPVAKELPTCDRIRARDRDRYIEEVRARFARQEQAIAHLAANGHSTALAEKRLMRRRQALDTLLERRKGEAEAQGSVPSTATPGQLGPAERKGQGSIQDCGSFALYGMARPSFLRR